MSFPVCFTSSSSYLAAGASFDAAKVIARKNDVSSLSTAASLARISGEVALAQSLALRCAKDLAAAQDWAAAQEVLSSQESLLVSGNNMTQKNFPAAQKVQLLLCFVSLRQDDDDLFLEIQQDMQPKTCRNGWEPLQMFWVFLLHIALGRS